MTDSRNPQDPKEQNTPKKGGFGAFEKQYRERWEAGHPDKKGGKTDPSAEAGESPEKPAADDDPSGPARKK